MTRSQIKEANCRSMTGNSTHRENTIHNGCDGDADGLNLVPVECHGSDQTGRTNAKSHPVLHAHST